MSVKRNTYKYYLKKGNRIVYVGITNNLKRRDAEHRQGRGGIHIYKAGHRSNRLDALKWEAEQRKKREATEP